MKTHENNEMMAGFTEIGDYLAEIVGNGFSLEIFTGWKAKTVGSIEFPDSNPESIPGSPNLFLAGKFLGNVPTPNPRTFIVLRSNEIRDKPELNLRTVKGATLAEALRKAVDVSRYIIGKPSLDRELDDLIAANERHARTVISTFPNAACSCGSRSNLTLERKIKFGLSWETGICPMVPFVDRNPKPGEIGTCPDCGRSYTFRP
jgi:hypothetical protein